MSALAPRDGHSLPVGEWPKIDRERWEGLSAPDKLSLSASTGKSYRSASQVTMAKIYGQWLGWLKDCDDLDEESTPESRVTEALILRYVEALLSRLRAQSVLTTVETIDSMIGAIAPTKDRTLLKAVIGSLKHHARIQGPLERKLVPIKDLYDLGFFLMHSAEEKIGPALSRAVTFRDGLIIALLVAVPVRRKNAHTIDMNANISWTGDQARIHFSPAQMKNWKPFEASVPPKLAQRLAQYIEIYRPQLESAASPRPAYLETPLWLNVEGAPLSYDGYYYIVKSRTHELLGFSVGPHQFRRCVASSIAIEDPEHVGSAAPVLGHSDIRMTESAYNKATSLTASRTHINVIRRAREKTRSSIIPPTRLSND